MRLSPATCHYTENGQKRVQGGGFRKSNTGPPFKLVSPPHVLICTTRDSCQVPRAVGISWMANKTTTSQHKVFFFFPVPLPFWTFKTDLEKWYMQLLTLELELTKLSLSQIIQPIDGIWPFSHRNTNIKLLPQLLKQGCIFMGHPGSLGISTTPEEAVCTVQYQQPQVVDPVSYPREFQNLCNAHLPVIFPLGIPGSQGHARYS